MQLPIDDGLRMFIPFAVGDVVIALISHQEIRIGLTGTGEITATNHESIGNRMGGRLCLCQAAGGYRDGPTEPIGRVGWIF